MIIPPLLKANSQAIIVAPSGVVPNNSIKEAIKIMQHWGLEVNLGKHVFSSDGVFAGNDKERLLDFQQALDNPQINLILCARGGYGLTRILDEISFDKLIIQPKWVVGFSDITAFHLAAAQRKIATIHGPMATSFNRDGAKDSIISLKQLLFNGVSIIKTQAKQAKIGFCKGEIVGGNLSLLCDSLGTATEIDTTNKILVLEDVGDYNYRIDRLLNQLARAGKFTKLKGLVVGSFSDMKNGDVSFKGSIDEMVNRVTANFDYPIAMSIPIGHKPQNFAFVHGANYLLEVTTKSARLELL